MHMCTYHIVYNFRRLKLSWFAEFALKGNFCENFRGWLQTPMQQQHCEKVSWIKNFVGAPKTMKSTKILVLKNFRLYGKY